MILESTVGDSQIDNFYISKSIRKINEIIFTDFKRLKTNPFTFSIQWKICRSFEKTPCEDEISTKIDKIIFDSNSLPSTKIKKIFEPDFKLNSIIGNCQNKEPKSPSNLTITVPVCGIFEYILPDDFATDKEDGSLAFLTATMQNIDFTALQRDTWINVNNNAKVLQHYPLKQ